MLGDVILEVGVYLTKGELLPCVVACLSGGVIVKSTVVAMIVHDLDSVLGRVLFKGELGFKCIS